MNLVVGMATYSLDTGCEASSSVASSSRRPKIMSSESIPIPAPASALGPEDMAYEELAMTTSHELWEIFRDKAQLFFGIDDMKRAIKSRYEKLQAGISTDQYLVFQPVTEDDLEKIDNQRRLIGRNFRITHCIDWDVLIIKVMAGVVHEGFFGTFRSELEYRFGLMGLPVRDFWPVGAGRLRGRSVSKEGDMAWKPAPLRPNKGDFPTLVIEAGVSESLRKLRADARWWLSNSGGKVNIVLVMVLKEGPREIQIERWESRPSTGPVTRSNPPIPTPIQIITIDSNNVTGAPLTLDFHLIFLRPINPNATPAENDIVFTAQDLRNWANIFWRGVN
jgi:hypothetical protein